MTPSSVITRAFVLTFGLAYPGYCSFKAIHRRDTRQYAQWMIYWIVFSLFLSVERFFDHFVIWIPFYYEMKIIIILWLVSPATKGSTLFYARYLFPFLVRREQEIDSMISAFNSLGYATLTNLFRRIFNLSLAFLGQIHYGILEVVKRQYNLQEVKPLEQKTETSLKDHPTGTPEEPKRVVTDKSSDPSSTYQVTVASESQAPRQTPKTPQLIKIATTATKKRTSPAATKQRTTSPITSTRSRSIGLSSQKIKTFVPEPGSYFERYLPPRQRPPAPRHTPPPQPPTHRS